MHPFRKKLYQERDGSHLSVPVIQSSPDMVEIIRNEREYNFDLKQKLQQYGNELKKFKEESNHRILGLEKNWKSCRERSIWLSFYFPTLPNYIFYFFRSQENGADSRPLNFRSTASWAICRFSFNWFPGEGRHAMTARFTRTRVC